MELRSWRGRSRRRICRPPLCVCLTYLLVCTALATGLSFSRYAAVGADQDQARVAVGILSAAGADGTLELDCGLERAPSGEYRFTVTNQENGVVSQVAVGYEVVVELTEPLPDGVTISMDGTAGAGSGKTYTFSCGAFAAGIPETAEHVLTIEAVREEVTLGGPYYGELSISVRAAQID